LTTDSDVLPALYSLDGLPVSSYREWLRERREDRSKKRLAELALDTFEALANQQSIQAYHLAPIIEAARSPYLVAWDIGMHFLCRLAAAHEVALDAMRNLMACRMFRVRVNLIAVLHDRLPKEFCIEIIRRGLADKSKRVREVAAGQARVLILHELLPELCRCAEGEVEAEMKLAMICAIALIRDRYFVYSRPDGSQAFVVRISDGYPAALLYPGPAWCTQADIDERGPKAVAEEIRRVSGRTRRKFRWDT
jgi:hypothetical protein